MATHNLPEYDSKPTFEEVVAYADREGLFGKVSLEKFYEYYNKQNFAYHGTPINWKDRLHEWAGRQTGKVTVSAREFKARQSIPKPRVFNMYENGTTTNEMEYLRWAVAQI